MVSREFVSRQPSIPGVPARWSRFELVIGHLVGAPTPSGRRLSTEPNATRLHRGSVPHRRCVPAQRNSPDALHPGDNGGGEGVLMEESRILELVERAQLGDREAFGELVVEFEPTVRAIVMRRLR